MQNYQEVTENYGKSRRKKVLTIKKNLLFQLLLIPLSISLIVVLPMLLFLGLGSIFGTRGFQFNIYIVFYVFSSIMGFLTGFIFSLFVKSVGKEKIFINRLIIYLNPALNVVVIGIVYFISIDAANVAAIAINPAFILSNLYADWFLDNFVPIAMLISTICYSSAFFIFTFRKFRNAGNSEEYFNQSKNLQNDNLNEKSLEVEPKLIKKNERRKTGIIYTIISLVLILNITLSTAICLPEIEYYNLEKKYEKLNLLEEFDFRLSEKMPFEAPSNVAWLNMPSTLTFNDIEKMPVIDGATAFYPMYSAFVQATYLGLREFLRGESSYTRADYLANYRGTGIVNCTQTNQAYKQLIDKKADIIFAFESSDSQLREAAGKGVELKLTKIGYDGFCFFVNTKNPVNNLSSDDVRKIYTGRIRNWKKVGGNNKRIFAFVRPESSGSQTIMENVVMKNLRIEKRYQGRIVRTMGGALQVVNGYLNTPNAIGYTFMFYSSSMVTVDSIKYLSINGVVPTPETVRSGSYLFSVPFYAITRKGDETKETSELLSWIVGEQGQELITKTGYVGL